MFLAIRAAIFGKNSKIQKSTLRARIFFSAWETATDLSLVAFNSYNQGLSMVIFSIFFADPPGREYCRVPWIVSYAEIGYGTGWYPGPD